MNRLIIGSLILLFIVGVSLVVAQNQEVTTSVTPIVDALKELVGIQAKLADGIPLKGEYILNEDAMAGDTNSVIYKSMPAGTCDYAFYVLEDDQLSRKDIRLDIASWNGEAYRDLTRQKTGTLTFDDDYYMVYLNMSSPIGPIGPAVGYFEYSCN